MEEIKTENQTQTPASPPGKGKRKKSAHGPKGGGAGTIVLIVVIVLAVLAGAAFGLDYAGVITLPWNSSFKFDENALDGQLQGKTQEEIQAELDRRVEENMLAISINTAPEYENGTAEGNIRIENSPANHYIIAVEIQLDEDGRTVYKSDGIKPGQVIEKAKLDEALSKGEYPATAYFIAYDQKNYKEVGRAGAELTLKVLN